MFSLLSCITPSCRWWFLYNSIPCHVLVLTNKTQPAFCIKIKIICFLFHTQYCLTVWWHVETGCIAKPDGPFPGTGRWRWALLCWSDCTCNQHLAEKRNRTYRRDHSFLDHCLHLDSLHKAGGRKSTENVMVHEMNMLYTQHNLKNDYQCTWGGAAGSVSVSPPHCSPGRNLGQTS